MLHKLPKLPYSYNALEPYIDKVTMKIHHTKHHQGYVDNLNKILENNQRYSKLTAEELLKRYKSLPRKIRQTVINNAGGHVNHSFFWNVMTPNKTKPEGEFLEMLNKKFGSLDYFKQKFTEKAMSLFGSGWTFLILTKSGRIRLKRHSFQNSPIMQGNIPVLGIDLWEHAYYLKYQNRKLDYINAWWNVVNWNKVEANFRNAIK